MRANQRGKTKRQLALDTIGSRSTAHERCFATCTADLEMLADWLKECGVTTVAMEATGVYWIPLFELLERRGFEVYLVDPRGRPNTPLAIIKAILKGQRDPVVLAKLRNDKCKHSEAEIARAWRARVAITPRTPWAPSFAASRRGAAGPKR